MDTATAARYAAVTVPTVRYWCRRGVVRAVKEGGRWVIDIVSLRHRMALGRRTAARLLASFAEPAVTREKALELVEQGALIPAEREGEYVAVSTDASSVYLVNTGSVSCGCKGYEYVGRCYHLVAALLVEEGLLRDSLSGALETV